MLNGNRSDCCLYPLTQGYYAIIDTEDLWKVRQYKWYILKVDRCRYATACKNGKTISMHRELLDISSGMIDHKNQNGIDNRKDNLRPCTSAQNQQNRGKFKNNKSGYCGVYYDKSRPKTPWCARITANKKTSHVGRFDTPEKAAKAYDKMAKKLHGDFARCNFD